jgi:thiazole synthase
MTPNRQAQRRFMEASISIRVNGEQRRVPCDITIADLARDLGLEAARVAVERNREIVPRSRLSEFAVADGDEYEIVTFVGGG